MLLTFVVLLVIASIVYDLGQILVARWNGVSTRWRFGYVKLLGEFQAKPARVRSAIIAAGPIANSLLAALLFALTWPQVGFVYVSAARIDELVPGGAADKAGLKAGDVIVSINGQAIESFSEVQRIVSGSANLGLIFEVERRGVVTRLRATPERREISDRFGNKLVVGVLGFKRNAAQQNSEFRRLGTFEYVGIVLNDTYRFIRNELDYVVGRGDRVDGDQLAKPFRLVLGPSVSGPKLAPGTVVFLNLLNLFASLSIGMGFIKIVLWFLLSWFVQLPSRS